MRIRILQKGLGDKIAVVDWDEWFYGTGWGPVRNKFDTTLADSAIALGKRCVCVCLSGSVCGLTWFFFLIQLSVKVKTSARSFSSPRAHTRTRANRWLAANDSGP